MNSKSRFSLFSALIASFLVFSFVAAPVASARYIFERTKVLHESDEATSSAGKGKNEETKQKVHDRLEKLKEKFTERLEEREEKACERVEEKITKRSEGLARRAHRMTNRFDLIAEKVKNYYEDKLVPQGVVVDNYDALVADIEAKANAVDEALDSANLVVGEFECTGESPKGVLTLFRTDMKSVISALKDHRKAVVDLIVAVRTKGKNIKSPGATSSAEPATSSAETE